MDAWTLDTADVYITEAARGGGCTGRQTADNGSGMTAQMTSRHKRVGLSLALEVAGRDAAGTRFAEHTRTLNVSGGGLCFESRRNLLVGTRLDLTIPLPSALRARFGGRDVYRVRALVCRVEQRPVPEQFHVGVRFLDEIEARRA